MATPARGDRAMCAGSVLSRGDLHQVLGAVSELVPRQDRVESEQPVPRLAVLDALVAAALQVEGLQLRVDRDTAVDKVDEEPPNAAQQMYLQTNRESN